MLPGDACKQVLCHQGISIMKRLVWMHLQLSSQQANPQIETSCACDSQRIVWLVPVWVYKQRLLMHMFGYDPSPPGLDLKGKDEQADHTCALCWQVKSKPKRTHNMALSWLLTCLQHRRQAIPVGRYEYEYNMSGYGHSCAAVLTIGYSWRLQWQLRHVASTNTLAVSKLHAAHLL